MTPQKFNELCMKHDFTYMFSDDNRYYLAGQRQYDEITEIIKKQPEYKPLWLLYNEYVFCGPAYNKPAMTQEQFESQRQAIMEFLTRDTS